MAAIGSLDAGLPLGVALNEAVSDGIGIRELCVPASIQGLAKAAAARPAATEFQRAAGLEDAPGPSIRCFVVVSTRSGRVRFNLPPT